MPDTTHAARSEADMVRGLRARDPRALGALYEQFGTCVFRQALSILRDRSTAENLTQEIFLYLWNRAGAFDATRGSLAHWVALVARSRTLDYVRSAEYRMARCTAPLETAAARTTPSPDGQWLERLDRQRMLRAAWRQLRRCERQALHLAYVSGMSQVEIAWRLDRPLGTVKTWMRHGLRTLRAALEGAGAV